MNTFILILTVYAGSMDGGVYVKEILFNSEKNCKEAGVKWQQKIHNRGTIKTSYVCVKK